MLASACPGKMTTVGQEDIENFSVEIYWQMKYLSDNRKYFYVNICIVFEYLLILVGK